ncbi:MAG: alpha/beta fold hydrolase [Candidatus Binatia bacterium]
MSASPASRFTSVNGVRLHYLDFGGDGPPAVLHHATGFHAWLWAPIARAMCARHRVLAVDARGHGDSDKPEGGYQWQVFIADLIAFMDELELGGAIGCGHSLGGTTIAGAAAERPDLFDSVVLIEPILFPREFSRLFANDNPVAAAARRRREHWASQSEAFRSYRGRGPFAKWRDEALRLYVEHAFEKAGDAVRLKCPPEIEAQVFSMASQFDTWGALDRVTVPALIVRGEESGAFSANDAAEAHRRLRGSEVVTVSGTTHLLPMEEPERVAEEILRFAAGPPIATRGLAHLALNVEKLEETTRFYRAVFGMRIVWQPDSDNVYLSSGSDNLALHRARESRGEKNGAPSPALDHLGFLVDSPERVFAAAEALDRRGIPIVHRPRHHRDGSCSLYVRDPDGNLVQILYDPNSQPRR